MQDLTISLIQSDIFWEDPAQNYLHFGRLIDRVPENTQVVILPEMFNTGFTINTPGVSETMAGPSTTFIRERAAARNQVIVTTLLISEGGSFYNRLLCAFPDGRLVTYDKRHLFRLVEEYKILQGGKERVIIDIYGWKVAPIICYDLRFPVWSKNTFANGEYGYDLLICPANWPRSRSHVWKTLLMARAIENQAYVAGVNRIGSDGNGTYHAGDSMVADPKGLVLKSATPGEEEIVTVTLSASELRLFRESFTVGLDWDSFTINQ